MITVVSVALNSSLNTTFFLHCLCLSTCHPALSGSTDRPCGRASRELPACCGWAWRWPSPPFPQVFPDWTLTALPARCTQLAEGALGCLTSRYLSPFLPSEGLAQVPGPSSSCWQVVVHLEDDCLRLLPLYRCPHTGGQNFNAVLRGLPVGCGDTASGDP